MSRLTKREISRLECPVDCNILNLKIERLSDFFEVVGAVITADQPFWFRGHQNSKWDLRPTALRFKDSKKRKSALGLWRDFQRVAEIKIDKPPRPNENLKWIQLARHYGVPTRLLDWTESAVFALFFAVIKYKSQESNEDGMVFMLNPEHLNKLPGKKNISSLDSPIDNNIVEKYLNLDPDENNRSGTNTIAIKPVWNSERLMMQRGAFTLHGAKKFSLDKEQAPSLIGIPILKESKITLRRELDKIGIDELTIFPELEYVSNNLTRKAGLT